MQDRDDTAESLYGQALVVTVGPFIGRICESDDSDVLEINELSACYRKRIKQKRRHINYRVSKIHHDGDSIAISKPSIECEVITFGFHLMCAGSHRIPREFLRFATVRDLVQRHGVISELVMRINFLGEEEGYWDIVDLLLEQNYIIDQIWARERVAMESTGPKNVFLCHSSADKYFVRQVHLDLHRAGHKAWLDEFEISVGDSIVDKINGATETADAVVLFISESSSKSSWVLREWSSTLMRQLSGKNVKIMPALIEECPLPSLLSDIKYADFRNSYDKGLEDLLRGLGK